MSENTRFASRDDDLAGLPPESRALYQELLADGAAWRAEQPATSHLDMTIATLMSQLTAPDATDTAVSGGATRAKRATGSRGWQTDTKGTLPMRDKRLRSFAATAAALAVVAALSVMLLNIALHRRNPSPTVASTPTVTQRQWVEQSRLLDPGASSDPAIAPTDPSVVYEVANAANVPGASGAYDIALRATADGGVTWHALAFPDGIQAANDKEAVFFVSPLNAQTVFLQLFDATTANCPPGSSVSEGGPMCILVFVSTNGGASWSPVHLPVAGVLGYAGPIGSAPLSAQGNRLYGHVACYGDASCTRIVVSNDGGLTWLAADGAIRAGGQSICNYSVSPSGATIFAVTASDRCAQQGQSAMLLWRSDDAGGHWSQVGALPQPFERGMSVTTNPAGGTPLLYIDMPKQIDTVRDKTGAIVPKLSDSPGDLRVSDDGGRTWQAAPTRGAPTDQTMYFGPYGTLADGSVVFPFVPNAPNSPTGQSLYTWKLGDTSWHELAPGLPTTTSYIETLTVTGLPGQGETLWAVTGDHQIYLFRP